MHRSLFFVFCPRIWRGGQGLFLREKNFCVLSVVIVLPVCPAWSKFFLCSQRGEKTGSCFNNSFFLLSQRGQVFLCVLIVVGFDVGCFMFEALFLPGVTWADVYNAFESTLPYPPLPQEGMQARSL